jgi:AraC family transcriptional regulator of adaptative response/methylated-DNA-[protein]-cysteine methyltransferase
METASQQARFELVAKALEWLVENRETQPSLAELASRLGLSEAYMQRIFQRFAGVTPKQFLRHLTRRQALQRLARGETVLDAALSSGLSGPGRLHDLLISTEALTPGEARRRGAGVPMRFGRGASPFGPALIAWTRRGVTFLGFEGQLGRCCELELRAQWPDARLQEDQPAAERWVERIFSDAGGDPTPVWLRGTPFQLKVWEALTGIPPGTHVSYGKLARSTGRPRAARAIGSAVGRNPVAWLIPCHRVINALGAAGGYRWGASTKLAMVGLEASRESAHSQSASAAAGTSGAARAPGSSAW